ncbi:MAG: hypothetical protein CM15mP122_4150 [Bacteroidota bacterium]|nr:MAG: hypothetical protein CM15mP122_4150 [Bacteroidota bacterium]
MDSYSISYELYIRYIVTPLSINEDTEIRRLTFATRSTVECPAAGAGLPSNVVSINVEEPRNQRLPLTQVQQFVQGM